MNFSQGLTPDASNQKYLTKLKWTQNLILLNFNMEGQPCVEKIKIYALL